MATIPTKTGDISASKLAAARELLAGILDHYHNALLGRNGRGLDYLKGQGLGDVAMLTHFKVGYVDGTLKDKLTPTQVELAQEMGLNDKGDERFKGSIIVPIFDEAGQPVGICGRAVDGSREAEYLNLPDSPCGVWNSAAVAAYQDELIVTENVFDGLALWLAGKRNCIVMCSAEGWGASHTELIQKHSVRKLVLAFDGNEAGDEAAKKLTPQLVAFGVKVHRLHWPKGIKNAEDYFQYNRDLDFKGTPEGFTALLSAAPRIGISRTPAEKPQLIVVEKSHEVVAVKSGSIQYRVKGLASQGAIKIMLAARKDEACHVDHLDLYTNKARKMFSSAAAERLGVDAGNVEEDLLALLDLLEKLRTADDAAAPTPSSQPTMSEAEREEALAFLRSPRLLDRIAADLEIVGYVGEARNKKLAYLISTSRLLPKPLSAIFRAQSGCGKSFLMECVAELCPPEQVHYFSRLTPQALYYLEPDALTHKLLIVDERDGSEEAEYPIRTLQTRRVLKLAVPVKDPHSGKIKTVVLEIYGPIAYMESTTDQRINPENANRCFELYLDESQNQTAVIFAAQRRARTLAGWQMERQREQATRIHHNAQRLLRPLKAIIPFVELIEFPVSWLRGRRDNDRFLSLIEGIAFLHQHQREICQDNGTEYITATIDDYAMAYDLAHQVFAQASSDLSKPASDFLDQMEKAMRQLARETHSPLDTFTFNRRDVREAVNLPDYIVKRYMRQIEELEYVQVQRAPQGGSYRYRLAKIAKKPRHLDGLMPPEALREKWNNWNKVGQR